MGEETGPPYPRAYLHDAAQLAQGAEALPVKSRMGEVLRLGFAVACCSSRAMQSPDVLSSQEA